jgi:LysM repeat protein
MQALRQFGTAVLVAIISLGLVVGGFSLALSESFTQPHASPTESLPTAPIFLTATNTSSAPVIPTSQPTLTNTPLPPPACNPPAGWVGVSVQPGDTLAGMAARYQTTPEQLTAANCLLSESLVPGSTLFAPPVPVNTPVPCGPPFGWVRYTVQPGDTLYHIATMYGITTSRLQQGNCLGYSTNIRSGQLLWVPNVPPRITPVPTFTPGITVTLDPNTSTPVPTDPLTETPSPSTSTPEPTSTTAPTSTSEPTIELPTATLTPFP